MVIWEESGWNWGGWGRWGTGQRPPLPLHHSPVTGLKGEAEVAHAHPGALRRGQQELGDLALPAPQLGTS